MKTTFYVLFILVCSYMIGCATVLSGTTSTIRLDSNPACQVDVDGGNRQSTPCSVNVSSKGTHTFRFMAPGYADKVMTTDDTLNFLVFGNILCGGLIGGVVDFADGAAWCQKPDVISVTLEPGYCSECPGESIPPVVIIHPVVIPTPGPTIIINNIQNNDGSKPKEQK